MIQSNLNVKKIVPFNGRSNQKHRPTCRLGQFNLYYDKVMIPSIFKKSKKHDVITESDKWNFSILSLILNEILDFKGWLEK